MPHLLAGPAGIVVLHVAASAAFAQWSFTPLHPGGPYRTSSAQAMRYGYAAGAATVLSGENYFDRAMVWADHTGWFNVHPPARDLSVIHAFDGWQYGGLTGIGTTYYAGVWAGYPLTHYNLHPAGYGSSGVLALAGGRQGGYVTLPGSGDWIAALWNGTPASFVALAPVGAVFSRVNAMDAIHQAGSVQFASTPTQAALWSGSPASYVNATPSWAVSAAVLGISQGYMCGWATPGGPTQATVWDVNAWTAQSYPVPGASQSQATAIHREHIVGFYRTASISHAAYWDRISGQLTNLGTWAPAGWFNLRATGVWSTSTTVYVSGWGYNSAAQMTQAVRWHKHVGPIPCGSADIGRTGGEPGADSALDNNDFVVYINCFFTGDPAADFGRTDGEPGRDGILNNNDFIAFIDAFFDGCGG